MTPISDIESATNAHYEIERLLMNQALWELQIGEGPATALAPDQMAFEVSWGKLIFSWWDEKTSQSWRIRAYELGNATLRLQAVRGLGRELTMLVFRDRVNLESGRNSVAESLWERKRGFATVLERLIEQAFRGVALTPAPGRSRRVSGGYARWVGKRAGRNHLFLGVSRGEEQIDIDGVLAAGLLWLEQFNEPRQPEDRAKSLVFCLPRNRSQTAIERLTFLTTEGVGARLECVEIDEDLDQLAHIRPSTQQELLNFHPCEASWPGRAVGRETYWTDRILTLAPDLIEVRARPGDQSEQTVGFSINGLEFARISGATEGMLQFGVPGVQERARFLSEANFDELRRLIDEIAMYRIAGSSNRRHPFYRLREESWLESMIRRDIASLDASLDPRYVYSQVPAWRGEQRSVLDLLCINREGRLVVIEIKAVEDPHLPLQGLDYWIRVEQARLRGDFQRRGFFSGVKFADSPSLLYLVAPRLRFHRSFQTIARAFSPEIEAFQIGLAGDWRKRIKVHTKERFN